MSEHCLFCGSQVGADHICERCGAVREAVDEKRIRARCPRCHDVRLIQFALGPVALQACGRCQGSFLPASEWDTLLDCFAHESLPADIVIPDTTSQGEDKADHSPYRTAAPPSNDAVSKPNLRNPVNCPTCEEPMDRLEFGGISGIIVDVCKLHGVWLDGGELLRIVDSRQVHTTPLIAMMQEQRATNERADALPAVELSAMSAFAEALRASHADAQTPSREQLFALAHANTAPRDATELDVVIGLGQSTERVLRRLSDVVRKLVHRIRST